MAKAIVVGAGSFGVWTAYQLLQKGWDVQLFDAWGPGHARASSGGETRVIRSVYGDDAIYVKLVAEALKLWRHYDQVWQTQLYLKTGNLWLLSGDDDQYLQLALPHLKAAQLPIEAIDRSTASQLFPQINFSEVQSVYLEQEAGLLNARKACRTVCQKFIATGGTYQQAKVQLGPIESGQLGYLQLGDQSRVQADQYIFACGPWLAQIFPKLLAPLLDISRQEVYFFGTPAGQDSFQAPQLPVWIDLGEKIHYGIPDHHYRGFKIADDTRQASFDPDQGDRLPKEENIISVRAYLQKRFPRLAQAPLLGAKVCQYTNTKDGHFVIDRHPAANNAWIAGAGCGHSFKMGPALGQYVSNLVTGEATIDPFFSLGRQVSKSGKTSQFKAHQQ